MGVTPRCRARWRAGRPRPASARCRPAAGTNGPESTCAARTKSWRSDRLPVVGGVLGGGGDGDDGDRDPEREADRGERGAGAGLVAAQVAERQPDRDGQAPRHRGQQPDGQRADEQHADDDGERPGRRSARVGPVGSPVSSTTSPGRAARQATPTTIERARRATADRRTGRGRGGRPDRACTVGMRAIGPGRPPRRAGGGRRPRAACPWRPATTARRTRRCGSRRRPRRRGARRSSRRGRAPRPTARRRRRPPRRWPPSPAAGASRSRRSRRACPAGAAGAGR